MPLTRRGWIFNNSLKSLRGRRTSSLPWPAPPYQWRGLQLQWLNWIKRSKPQQAKSNKRWQRPWSLLNPALRQRIASWQQHATIIGGRYQSGKSVATEEALRGARGVVRFTIRSADWTDRMCKHLGVDDEGLFKEVMRRAREKLKDSPDNLTKFPILPLEVPRTTGWTKYVFQLSIDAVAHFALVFLFPFRLPRHQLNLFYCEGWRRTKSEVPFMPPSFNAKFQCLLREWYLCLIILCPR